MRKGFIWQLDLKAHEMNIHYKVSLESIFESKSEQFFVAQYVAKGFIWQLDLKAHEMNIHYKVSLESIFESKSKGA